MLEPQSGRQLFDALRPPAGFQLDQALGTTFSLDLLALLTAPLAFTFFEWAENPDELTADPVALLDTLRRYAERITIFCHAGQIVVPRYGHLLYSQLEHSVVQVRAQRQSYAGVFHPKIWLLRFVSPDQPTCYRLLCLSRNLTFDRSWDTVLVLEGSVGEIHVPESVPLADFVTTLPLLATHVPDRVWGPVELIATELSHVVFTLPEGFTSLRFWPLMPGTPAPFPPQVERMLIISPFLGPQQLAQLTSTGRNHVLISQVEALTALPTSIRDRFQYLYVLTTDAQPAADDHDVQEANQAQDGTLQGLHAKVYVAENGDTATVWTGSANATKAAFTKNVEFLVELRGRKPDIGIEQLLHGGDDVCLVDLLQRFAADSAGAPPDAAQRRLEDRLAEIRCMLGSARMTATVMRLERVGTEHFQLRLWCDVPSELRMHTLELSCYPVTLPPDSGIVWDIGAVDELVFAGPLSFEALTAFFAFKVVVREGQRVAEASFVRHVEVEGMPADRESLILRSILHSRDRVMRFMLLLLAESGVDTLGALSDMQRWLERGGRSGSAPAFEFPLFEMLLRALDRDPGKLDQLERLVRDLQQTEEGVALLPEGFMQIWEPIWTTRERQKR